MCYVTNHRGFFLRVPYNDSLVIRAADDEFAVIRNGECAYPILVSDECAFAETGVDLPQLDSLIPRAGDQGLPILHEHDAGDIVVMSI